MASERGMTQGMVYDFNVFLKEKKQRAAGTPRGGISFARSGEVSRCSSEGVLHLGQTKEGEGVRKRTSKTWGFAERRASPRRKVGSSLPSGRKISLKTTSLYDESQGRGKQERYKKPPTSGIRWEWSSMMRITAPERDQGGKGKKEGPKPVMLRAPYWRRGGEGRKPLVSGGTR